MPLINTFDYNKFHAITERFKSKRKSSKQASADSKFRTSNASNRNNKTTLINTVAPPAMNVMRLDSHMQTKSGENVYLSSTIHPNVDLNTHPTPKKENPNALNCVNVNLSGDRLNELKAMRQHLANITWEHREKPTFEPRQSTLESLKQAIEKDKKSDSREHKGIGTSDLNFDRIPNFSNAMTSTTSKTATTQTKSKKHRKEKVTTAKKMLKAKKKKKKHSKNKFPSSRYKE